MNYPVIENPNDYPLSPQVTVMTEAGPYIGYYNHESDTWFIKEGEVFTAVYEEEFVIGWKYNKD